MNLTYKRATTEALDLLTETRIRVLRAANRLSDNADMSEVERNRIIIIERRCRTALTLLI